MTWQMANSLSLMAIAYYWIYFHPILPLFPRHPNNQLPSIALGLHPWAGVYRIFDAGNQSYIIYNSQQHTNKYLQYINFVYCYHLFPNDQM